jgi:hypothetical protein
MMGFIHRLYSLLVTARNYSAIVDLHTLQFTVTHKLGFSVFTSRILVTDFNTGTVTGSLNHTLQISLYYSTYKVFSSQPDVQLPTELHSVILTPQFFKSVPLLPNSYPSGLASRNSTDSNDFLCPFYNPSARTAQRAQLFYYCVNLSPRKRTYPTAP